MSQYYIESYETGNQKEDRPPENSKRDIFISDKDTWDIYYDLKSIMSKRIPKNPTENKDFDFMRGIISHLTKDGYVSELQMKRLKTIYDRYHNV